jgi:hypothetical protein
MQSFRETILVPRKRQETWRHCSVRYPLVKIRSRARLALRTLCKINLRSLLHEASNQPNPLSIYLSAAKLKDFLPPQYHKLKGFEKEIAREHQQKLTGMSEVNAKYRYDPTTHPHSPPLLLPFLSARVVGVCSRAPRADMCSCVVRSRPTVSPASR